MHAQTKETARSAELARADLEKVRAEAQKEKDKKPERLTLGSMGAFMTSLNYTTAIGQLWFTNVSNRHGVVCALGTAVNSSSHQSSESLPSCKDVEPYASVQLSFAFAGGDLSSICPNGSSTCKLTVTDVQDGMPK
jgi:hypothetical protein